MTNANVAALLGLPVAFRLSELFSICPALIIGGREAGTAGEARSGYTATVFSWETVIVSGGASTSTIDFIGHLAIAGDTSTSLS